MRAQERHKEHGRQGKHKAAKHKRRHKRHKATHHTALTKPLAAPESRCP